MRTNIILMRRKWWGHFESVESSFLKDRNQLAALWISFAAKLTLFGLMVFCGAPAFSNVIYNSISATAVSGTADSSGYFTAGISYSVKWSAQCDGVESVALMDGDSQVGVPNTYAPTPDFSQQCQGEPRNIIRTGTVTARLSPGVHSLRLKINSHQTLPDYFSQSFTVTVVSANTPPTAAMVAPANGNVFYAPAGVEYASVRVRGVADDVNNNLSGIEVWDNNVRIRSVSGGTVDEYFNLGLGSHAIKLVARDLTGLTGESATVNVRVDPTNVAPTATLSSPGNNAVYQLPWSATTVGVQILGSAADNNGNLSKVEVLVDGEVKSTVNGGTVNVTLPVGAGSHTIKLVAWDSEKLSGQSAIVNIQVNAYSPGGVQFIYQEATASSGLADASGTFSAGIRFSAKLNANCDAIERVELFDGNTRVDVKKFNYQGSQACGGDPENVVRTATLLAPLSVAEHDLKLAVFSYSGLNDGFSTVFRVNVVANSAPTVTLTAPVNNTVVQLANGLSSVPVRVQGSGVDQNGNLTGIDVHVDNSYFNVSGGSVNSDVQLSAGVHSIYLVAVDAMGATGSSATSTVTVNRQPSVSLIAPASNSTVLIATGSNAATVSIVGGGTDPDGSVTSIDVYVDDVKLQPSVTGANVNLPIQLSEGTHRIKLVAFDNLGGVAESSTNVVTVKANALPSVSISAPGTGSSFIIPTGSNAYPVRVLGAASDTDGTIVSVEVGVAGLAPQLISGANVDTTLSLPPGTHSIRLLAKDDAGGAATATVSVTVNANVLPTVNLVGPASGSHFVAPVGITTFDVRIVGNASDPEGSIKKIDVWDGSQFLRSFNAASVDFVATLGVGNHGIKLVAEDQYGGTSQSSIASITITTNIAPAVTLAAPISGSKYTIPVGASDYGIRIMGSATDTGGAIRSLEVVMDETRRESFSSSSVDIIRQFTAGTHTIKLVATDDNGAVSESSLANVDVIGVQQQLTSINVVPPALTNPDGGTLPGQLTVSPSGAASYSLPIEVPPGTAGLKPSLSLNYSSQAGNGFFGLGWSLGGLSSIHRCGQTIAQDGVNGRIRFDLQDRLCLDGQRLVLVNLPLSDANYWSDGAEYRTEVDQISRVTAQLTGGKRSFKVESKDGRISTYGSTTSSYVNAVVGPINSGVGGLQPLPKSGALSWAVDRIADRAGNFISFAYEQDQTTGEHRPSAIRYGGAGLASHAAVQFEYEARPDAWKRYVDEARNDIRSRVTHIKTYVGNNLDGDVGTGGALVRDYSMSYEKSPTSGRSLLKTIQACARNPQTSAVQCLPATTFANGKPDPNKVPGFESRGFWANAPVLTTTSQGRLVSGGSSPTWALHPEYFAFSDFDNNGLTDALELRVASPATPFPSTTESRAADSNFITKGTMRNQYRYFHNTGSGFSIYNYKISTGENFAVLRTGDFNGDGALDLLVATSTGAKICLSPLANPAGLGAAGSTITFACNSAYAAIGGNDVYKIPYVVDVLGDGRSAHLSRINQDTSLATLCLQGGCSDVSNAPREILAYDYSPVGEIINPLNSYVSFSQMVDFSGTGKPQDVRWTKPYYLKNSYDDQGQTQTYVNRWYNTTPTVKIGRFLAPGSIYVDSALASYSYAGYNLGGCVGSQVNAGCAPYYFDRGDSQAADFNGSGYSGLMFGFVEQSFGNPPTRAETTVCLSTGRALDCSVRKKYSGTNYMAIDMVGNFVGDGEPSYMATSKSTSTPPISTLQMCRVMGDDTTGGTGTDDSNIACSPWAVPPFSGLGGGKGSVFYLDLLGTGRPQMIRYYRGSFDENQTWIEDGRWEVLEPVDISVAGQALDRIYQVTNGLGATATVEYVDGVSTGVVSRSNSNGLSYPQHASPGLGKIVKRLRLSNGVSAERSTRYSYKDQAIDVAGRGSLGFGSVESFDEQTQLTTKTTYNQTWPFVGSPKASQTVSAQGVVLMESVIGQDQRLIAQANGAATRCVLTSSSTVTKRDLDGSAISFVKTDGGNGAAIEYDAQCNLLKSVETTAQDSSLTGPVFSTTTVNSYVPADSLHWLNGLVSANQVTRQQAGGTARTRTKGFTYDPSFKGWVTGETIQAGNAALKTTISYDRSGNPFGLVNGRTESWNDPLTGTLLSRTTSTIYDAKGRFPENVSNALGHPEVRASDPGSGAQTSLTGPNSLKTQWTVDGFGRVLTELRADGNETRKYVKQCGVDCPLGAAIAQVTEQFRGADRIAVPEVSFLDSAGHVLRKQTWGFDGRAIVSDQTYDSLGRVYEAEHPRFVNDTAYLASRQTYDELNRVRTVTTWDEQGTAQTLSNQYAGLTTTITNAKAQQRVDTRDPLGQLIQVKDAKLGITKFGYEAFGGLATTTDPNGNVITVNYDDLGRKTDLRDPNLGWIQYIVDPAGRTRRQISPVQRAKSQSTDMTYDLLDRMTLRMEPDLESHWVYDSANKGIGQLAEAYTGTPTAKDYRRVHDYDSLGRPSTTTQYLPDGIYTSQTAFDAWGRQLMVTHKRASDSPKSYINRFNAYGFLSSIERNGSALWQASAQDASHRVTAASFGNGLLQNRAYSPYTGRQQTGMVKTAGNVVRLQEGYAYDPLGSVTQRQQYWDSVGFTEGFDYDELNRLKTAQVTGQALQSFNYDAAGNLMGKSGVGSYAYPAQGPTAVRPHAVQSISGIAGIFAYDDNGNLSSGAGRTASWNSFDMPVTISKGGASSTFVYGPDHQRVKQTRSDGLVILYAGAQEVETKAGQVTVKTYWPAGLGVEIDRPGAASTELSWTHVDRLGSPVAITDAAGNLREKLGYDAWGKRRTTDGSATPDSLDGVVDNKGFTRHEMLDQLDLVHMNGRVYDPLTAKFMSGDPLIQDPVNGQNYNRYAYVLNNPTNMTDPTGFAYDCGGSKICENTIERAVRAAEKALNNLDADSRAAVASAYSATIQSFGISVKSSDSGGSKPNTAGGDVAANSKQGGQAAKGTAADLQRETAATIGNAAKVAVGNLIPDAANGGASWLERFFHTSDGALGRMSPWVDVRNDVAQEAAGDLRSAGAAALAAAPLVRAFAKAGLLEELRAGGVKVAAENIVDIRRLSSGQIVFLETGNSKAGLAHILQSHGADFERAGISRAQVPGAVMDALSTGRVVGYQGSGTGRAIFELPGGQRIAVTVGSNGFVVGANPAGR